VGECSSKTPRPAGQDHLVAAIKISKAGAPPLAELGGSRYRGPRGYRADVFPGTCRVIPPLPVIAAAGNPGIAGQGAGATPPADILLLPGRGALLPASRTLLVADLHLGKAATFRRAGIPIPEGSAQGDLARLEALIRDHAVARVLVLGDLLHAASGCTPDVVAEFRAFRDRLTTTAVVLVLGNHDVAARRLAGDLGLDACVSALDEPPLRFVHIAATATADDDEATPSKIGLVVAGHVHPRVKLRAPSGDRFADRCFHLDDDVLTLPAFGSFTGGHAVEITDRARVWLARDDAVLEVTRLARPATRR
jgi:DNA ligase-associated metallophosphoesterase